MCSASPMPSWMYYRSEQRNLDWQIRVFEAEQPNAFALPGGYMGVNTGMLNVATNQDQLASVVGHEIGHVLARHANQRASTENATSLGLSVISSASGMQTPGGQQLMGVLGMARNTALSAVLHVAMKAKWM